MDWFRSWHGAPTDNKWLLIARKAGVVPGIVSAIAWALLDHASQAEDRGSVCDFDIETYSVFSGFSEDDIAKVMTEMVQKGVIVNGRLIAWERRQPKREDSTANERQRRRRDKSRDVTDGAPDDRDNDASRNVTQRHALSRRVTHGHDREEERRGDSESPSQVIELTPLKSLAKGGHISRAAGGIDTWPEEAPFAVAGGGR
jgi:hypothetical protein